MLRDSDKYIGELKGRLLVSAVALGMPAYKAHRVSQSLRFLLVYAKTAGFIYVDTICVTG